MHAGKLGDWCWWLAIIGGALLLLLGVSVLLGDEWELPPIAELADN